MCGVNSTEIVIDELFHVFRSPDSICPAVPGEENRGFGFFGIHVVVRGRKLFGRLRKVFPARTKLFRRRGKVFPARTKLFSRRGKVFSTRTNLVGILSKSVFSIKKCNGILRSVVPILREVPARRNNRRT
jgi:hypothetical protein